MKGTQCELCNSSDSLTLHHIVPLAYVRHFSDALKSRFSQKTALLCEDCHKNYNMRAHQLHNRLLKQAGISTSLDATQTLRKEVRAAYGAIVRSETGHPIPERRIEEAKQIIISYFGTLDLERAGKIHIQNANHYHYEQLVKKLENGDMVFEKFIETWKTDYLNFLAKHKAKFN